MENGNIIDKDNFITIAIHPSEEGFACVLLEKENPPVTQEYLTALTVAHGMVKIALERPDLIYDEGVDAMQNPSKNTLINIKDILQSKKRKLN